MQEEHLLIGSAGEKTGEATGMREKRMVMRTGFGGGAITRYGRSAPTEEMMMGNPMAAYDC